MADERVVARPLAEGIGDDAESEAAEVIRLRRDYYDRCRAFLDFQDRGSNRDAAELVRELRSGRAGFEWGLLGGHPVDALRRSRMEAERYIREYESGTVL